MIIMYQNNIYQEVNLDHGKNPITDHNGISIYKYLKLIYDINNKTISNIFENTSSAEEFVYYQLQKHKINIIKHDINTTKSFLISKHNHPRI